MARNVVTQLMFEGTAEEAMNFYVSLFRGSQVTRVERYGPGEPGAEGSVKRAEFTLGGHRLACIDSPIKHGLTFTPSMSLFVDCEDEAEMDAAFAGLSKGGAVLMPPGNYGFSAKFAWVNDRFGVSWRINLSNDSGTRVAR
jgi:predicted 3-demethylubiquinone-9 3-methyltransferase (glyoxalase superfamily)